MLENSVISDSAVESMATLPGTECAGGLAYQVDASSQIQRSSAGVSISPSLYYAGGLVAILAGSVTDSFATGSVKAYENGSGPAYAGGLAGAVGATTQIARSYAATIVQSSQINFNSSADQPQYEGGFIGDYTAGGTYIDNYFDADLSTLDDNWGIPQGNIAGVTGLSTSAMQSAVNFSGFDFVSVWDISEGAGYPFLR